MNIGVVGLGGLGHMVVKWGKAFGCKVGTQSGSPQPPGMAEDQPNSRPCWSLP